MIFDRTIMIAMGGLLALPAAKADLAANLSAYYDFEQTGASGLANKAPGATGHDAIRGGTAQPDWATGENPTGPGFAGKAEYLGTTGTSDRSLMIVGKALNLDDERNEYVEIPLGSAQLDTSFSIATWHALTPGSSNTSGRYHVFEASNGFDISWGTSSTSFTTPQSQYSYLAYVGEGAGFGPSPLPSTVWNHVVHSFSSDGSTTTLRLYVNGEFVSSRTAATSSMDFPSILLGRHRTTVAQDREWDGMLDEVAVWNRALTPNDAKELFLRGAEGFGVLGNLSAANKGFISVSPSSEAGGTVSGTELYDYGEVANIDAAPAPGYLFAGWSGPFAGKPASFTHSVTGSVESIASFIADTADDDHDGLTNYQELAIYFTVPDDADTDDDGINDGNEVHGSLTDPLISQQAAVQYILANLCNGGIQPGDLVLARNTVNSTLSFRLKVSGSTTLGAWSPIVPSASGLSGSAADGEFHLSIPGTTDTRRLFRFEAVTP